MNKVLFLLLAIACSSVACFSQAKRCGNDVLPYYIDSKNPGFLHAFEQSFEQAKMRAKQKDINVEDLYRIPVVVHVVYNTDPENVSDEIIQSQIDVLNADFRRTNADASLTRSEFLPIVGDANIEFYLATEDPQGMPTTGITRTETSLETFGIDAASITEAFSGCGVTDPNDVNQLIAALPCILTALDPATLDAFTQLTSGDYSFLDRVKSDDQGGKSPWDTQKYLNLWVADLGGILLGYAYPPAEAPNWPTGSVPTDVADKDGVVIHYEVFGINPALTGGNSPYNGLADQGRAAVHEVGHYLGLRHIWGDGDCTMDDGIDDTPDADNNHQPTALPVPSCETLFSANTCSEPSDEKPDMIENYMDYSIESCQNAFTIGQIEIMRSMIAGPRAGLLWQAEQPSTGISTLDNGLTIFPQPAFDNLNINFSGHLTGQEIAMISSINGQVIKKYAGIPNSINLADLSDGIYVLQIINDLGTYTTKLIIRRN